MTATVPVKRWKTTSPHAFVMGERTPPSRSGAASRRSEMISRCVTPGPMPSAMTPRVRRTAPPNSQGRAVVAQSSEAGRRQPPGATAASSPVRRRPPGGPTPVTPRARPSSLRTSPRAPYGPTLGAQPQQPTGPMTLSMGASAGPAPAISGVFRAPGTGQPLPGVASGGNRPPAAATAAGTRVETAAGAPTNKTAPAKPASSMQRAEAILEQLKVRIQGGDREATINLNPVDLGRAAAPREGSTRAPSTRPSPPRAPRRWPSLRPMRPSFGPG